MMVKLTDVSELGAAHVKIKDPAALERKLHRMRDDGWSNLHVVADFDCTLTKQRLDDGRKLITSFGMFCECPSVPEEYKLEDKRLCDIYKPIEVDPKMTIEEKSKHMVEWYTVAKGLLKGFKTPTHELETVADYVVKNLRDGVFDMFNKLTTNKVPILVFSAGLGDAVMSVLKVANLHTPNVKVISNFLNVDDEGYIDGMKGTVIHVFNKNETAIKNTEYYDMIKEKANVILLGDTLGDAMMADGMDHHEAVIKIGFLYHNQEGNLPLYMDAFDIVLVDDQTMDVPNALLNIIT